MPQTDSGEAQAREHASELQSGAAEQTGAGQPTSTGSARARSKHHHRPAHARQIPQISKEIWGELRRGHRLTAVWRNHGNIFPRCRAVLPSCTGHCARAQRDTADLHNAAVELKSGINFFPLNPHGVGEAHRWMQTTTLHDSVSGQV